MYIRLLSYSDDEEQAKKIVNELFKNEQSYIKKIEHERFEPYWKFDDMFEIEFEVQFNEAFTQKEFERFIGKISDKWICLGDPVHSILASDTTEGCNYIRKGIGLIKISF